MVHRTLRKEVYTFLNNRVKDPSKPWTSVQLLPRGHVSDGVTEIAPPFSLLSPKHVNRPPQQADSTAPRLTPHQWVGKEPDVRRVSQPRGLTAVAAPWFTIHGALLGWASSASVVQEKSKFHAPPAPGKFQGFDWLGSTVLVRWQRTEQGRVI